MPTIDQFAVILYTLRDFLKSRDAALDTFDKIATIGYKSVQISGMNKDLFTEEELVEELGKRGLSICATHEPTDDILYNTDAVIERLKKLGTQYTASSLSSKTDFANESSVSEFIQALETAGKKMAEAGLILAYHNHAHEFYLSNGKTILERIYAETNPQHLQAEIDVYWVQRGGGNPVKWVESLEGRSPLIHLKDYKVNVKGEGTYAEIGNGTLDFPAIVAAAEKAGCKHFIVEQDTCEGDPFDSIAQSFAYISKHLVTQ
jgi:sugar phosphate isomerase/epimerase